MKRYERRCATTGRIHLPLTGLLLLICLTVLLTALLASCTDDRDVPADSMGESGTSEESIVPDGTRADTEPTETPADTEVDTLSAAETAAETETETDDRIDAPRGYVRLYTVEELMNRKTSNLTCTPMTDENGMSYVNYRPTALDPTITLSGGSQTAIENAQLMRIKYRVNAELAGKITGRLYLGTNTITEAGALAVPYIADGEWHTLTLDLTRSSAYADRLKRVRFDPMDGADVDSESIDIAWIAFYPTMDDYDPTEDLPTLPDDAPNLSVYEQTPDGSAYYRVSGALSGSDGTYTFKEDFRLDVYRRGYFNRYTLGYSSTSPIRGEITYLLWAANGESTTYTEVFFLEAGEDMTFSSLIDGYFDGTYAWGITGITMRTCDGSVATFTVHRIADNCIKPCADTYYLENDRYKLGVLLTWGGGISYIEDKLDGDEAMTNLINRADPGRLIQQSYYGVGNGPYYTAATYNGTMWSYNPVQGGDQYGHGSKLVDVSVSEDGLSIYVKCRPMDWAQYNSLTPSYMENTYTLTADGIVVSNRFVDFFGVEHPYAHAELPAFYTISHLGVFHYYNGTKPWTGDAYETLPDEEFWAGRKSAYHTIVEGNTETWAAWTNESGYGIGLYVPGTEIMLAGRHAYNGSKDPANGGTSYVAPLRTMRFTSFVPFEYEYVIAAGTVDEMRAVFARYAGH